MTVKSLAVTHGLLQGEFVLTVPAGGTFTKTTDGQLFITNFGATGSPDLVLDTDGGIDGGSFCVGRNGDQDPDLPTLQINQDFTDRGRGGHAGARLRQRHRARVPRQRPRRAPAQGRGGDAADAEQARRRGRQGGCRERPDVHAHQWAHAVGRTDGHRVRRHGADTLRHRGARRRRPRAAPGRSPARSRTPAARSGPPGRSPRAASHRAPAGTLQIDLATGQQDRLAVTGAASLGRHARSRAGRRLRPGARRGLPGRDLGLAHRHVRDADGRGSRAAAARARLPGRAGLRRAPA